MTGQRIIRPNTAFSVSPTKGQKRPREHNHAHLAFIRTLRCCLCGAPGPDPAHIRSASPIYGKRETGMQEKPSDKWTVPLCRTHHDEQHKAGNELLWWASKKIDPFGLALALHHATGDDEVADGILRASRPIERRS
jgi:hypothetical protein